MCCICVKMGVIGSCMLFLGVVSCENLSCEFLKNGQLFSVV